MGRHCASWPWGPPAALPIYPDPLQASDRKPASLAALRPPVATMPTPTGSDSTAQQQPEEHTSAACNGSNKEQQCGDEGCGGGGGDPLPAAAAVPPPGTVCIKCRKQEAEVSTACMHIVQISISRHSSQQHAVAQCCCTRLHSALPACAGGCTWPRAALPPVPARAAAVQGASDGLALWSRLCTASAAMPAISVMQAPPSCLQSATLPSHPLRWLSHGISSFVAHRSAMQCVCTRSFCPETS